APAGVSTHGVEANVGTGTGSTRGVRVGAVGAGFVHGVKAGVESGSLREVAEAFGGASELMDAVRAAPISSAIEGEPEGPEAEGPGAEGRWDGSAMPGSGLGGVLASSAIVGNSGDGPLAVGARGGPWGEEGGNRSGAALAGLAGAAGGVGLGSSERRPPGEAV